MAASSASAVGSMVFFALTRGKPGIWAARTQLVLLSSIASTSVQSWSRAIGWKTELDVCAMTRLLQGVPTVNSIDCPLIALMGSVGAAARPLAQMGSAILTQT